MQDLPKFNDPNMIVGAEHFSDAGVYRLTDEIAMVQTVDFFPPLVNDPFVFGQIAAANSLSDCYAMGGQPKTALNIVCFPDDEEPLSSLQGILKGGADRIVEAGAVILGGHSVRDAEIKYGLAVTGIVHPKHMLSNDKAKPGDVLVLTKALGTGFVTTALRSGKCSDELLKHATDRMIQLNKAAAQAAIDLGATAATDITGFGLSGHAGEMAQASNVTLHLHLSQLPKLPGADDFNERGYHTRANATNREFTSPLSRFEVDEKSHDAEFLFDPQTSGGLLIAIAPDKVQDLIQRCHDQGVPDATVIGEVKEKQDCFLSVHK